MKRKKRNRLLDATLAKLASAAFNHGVAFEKLQAAARVEKMFEQEAQKALDEIWDLVKMPSKKEIN